jgi:hypothetical protein
MKIGNILLGLLLVVAGLLLGKVWLQNSKLDQANSELNKKLMEANLEIGRAHTRFGEADALAKKLDKDLRDEIAKRKGDLTRIGELEAELKARGEGTGTTVVVTGPTVEVPANLNLAVGMLYMAVEPNKLVTVEGTDAEYQDFRLKILAAIRPKPNTELKIPVYFQYQLDTKIEGQLVETRLPSGAINNYIRLWELDDKGNRVGRLTLTKFEMVVEDERQKHLFLLDPHLDFTVFAGTTFPPGLTYGGDVGLSLSGYGLTPNDLSWRFVRVGLGLGDGLSVSLTPALYNLGELLPLVSNIWIGPGVRYGLDTKDYALHVLLGAVL